MKKLLYALLALTLAQGTLLADAPESQPARLGYLLDPTLAGGKEDDWRQAIDRLQALGFDYVGTSGTGPSADVAAYLAEKGLVVRPVVIAGADSTGETGARPLIVLDVKAQKGWIAGMPDLAEGSEVLWSDDGTGAIAAWPHGTRGHRLGVLIHAGGGHNGPLMDPYPRRIGETLAEAAKRGLAGNVLVAAPTLGPFRLNVQAAALAARNPAGFDGDAFYRDWAEREYGAKAAVAAVKSLKLLHGAHEQVGGVATVSGESAGLLEDIRSGKARGGDLNPIHDALRLSRRALELAEAVADKTEADQARAFERDLLDPTKAFVHSLELLETLNQLGSAWKIHAALPSAVSAQRVQGLIDDAAVRAGIARISLAELPGGAGLETPTPEGIRGLREKPGADTD